MNFKGIMLNEKNLKILHIYDFICDILEVTKLQSLRTDQRLSRFLKDWGWKEGGKEGAYKGNKD